MKVKQNIKRKLRVRSKLKKFNLNNRFRLTVNRSLKNISAQIIDDTINKTLVSASSLEKNIKGTPKNKKSSLSTLVANTLAKRASEKNIKKIYLDRGSYKYHGRLKLLVESLRKNGMDFWFSSTLCTS